MKKFLICDDDSGIHSIVQKEIKEEIGEVEDCKFVSFVSGRDMLASNEVKDAYGCFLDIELNNENGINIAMDLYKVNPDLKIFFVSNYESLVFQAIHARPVRFIRKKFIGEDLTEAVHYIKTDISKIVEMVHFENGKKQVEFRLDKIIYIENSGHYINISTVNGVQRVRGKAADYADMLKERNFVQIQKGILINMEFINQIRRGFVVLKNNEKFNISRERQDEVNRTVMRFLRREVE
ncbi:MAG: LytR/AlgR family response regulator transcription factor [Lachnospiraceae bacterium]